MIRTTSGNQFVEITINSNLSATTFLNSSNLHAVFILPIKIGISKADTRLITIAGISRRPSGRPFLTISRLNHFFIFAYYYNELGIKLFCKLYHMELEKGSNIYEQIPFEKNHLLLGQMGCA
uniref:Uncharacterized protein n=1 Tax=Glossina pallidipes TaxID=7398 RepID=A0A1B0AEG4_GLOPL